ncbi:TPA: CoA ester lyase [Pseudomonas aeruginosa]|uniref:HpcH/HpaI aldolase/citrate lyase family protein n=1 Tax=Pseudomonas aeruginosa TaxID=287 RepID=UPI00136AA133|nr:CoA ester lyase [Pseudomonas aeruginosa]MXU51426.1 HpcH/HpaI aldolase/citrate lyase family protein [Pseudomonas aeruginosa]HBN9845814.1 CoA ester lyase [Pseudomonas aeruginosa]HBN9848321.1 CoA ester lyase [Pseudomonas aeruginosa]
MNDISLGEALLFCPGDRPDRFAKALHCSDRIILDLEDAVSPSAKAQARNGVIDALASLGDRVIVRINATTSEWFAADIQALRDACEKGIHSPLIMLPKAETIEQLNLLPGFSVIALCETAMGVQNASILAKADNCVALFWGGEDLIADLGGCRSRGPSGRYYPLIEQARSTILLAAAAQRKPAIDAVHIDITDLDGLARESREASDLGFRCKACIHPSHVATIRQAFVPSDDRCRWAIAVVAAMDSANGGVASVNGQMIDEPLYKQALRIIEAASRTLGPTEIQGPPQEQAAH